MAQITIEIPDAYATRVVEAFAQTYGWTADSGLTKTQFAKKQVAEFIKNVFKHYEAHIASNQARDTSLSETGNVNIE
jgi:hypothetical protein